MRRKRRNHLPGFKAKVALAAIKGDKTLAELSEQFDVHQNQIQDWKKQLLDQADSVFGSSQVRILVIPITCSGFIRSPDLPNAMDPIVSL